MHAHDIPVTASFLGIPLELRLRIFTCLFIDSKIHFHILRRTPGGKDRITPFHIRTKHYHSSITESCHQLRKEALPLLCTYTTLKICSFDKTATGELIVTIPEGVRSQVRRLEIDCDLAELAEIKSLFPAVQYLKLKRLGAGQVPGLDDLTAAEILGLIERRSTVSPGGDKAVPILLEECFFPRGQAEGFAHLVSSGRWTCLVVIHRPLSTLQHNNLSLMLLNVSVEL